MSWRHISLLCISWNNKKCFWDKESLNFHRKWGNISTFFFPRVFPWSWLTCLHNEISMAFCRLGKIVHLSVTFIFRVNWNSTLITIFYIVIAKCDCWIFDFSFLRTQWNVTRHLPWIFCHEINNTYCKCAERGDTVESENRRHTD